jgi:hypothetical protein
MISQISQANTFGEHIVATSALISVANNLVDGPAFVSNASITLTNPGVGLNVSNTAIINTANVLVLNLTTLNTSYGTFSTLNVSSANLTTTIGDTATFNTLNASSANLTFISAAGANLATANIASLNVAAFNLSSPVITGTVTGVYTLAGTPTIAAPTISGNAIFSNLTAGSIPFIWSGGVLTQDNGALFWDNDNKRMGIGISTPIASVHVHVGSASIAPRIQITGPTTGASATDGLKIGLDVNSSNAYVWNHEAGKLSFGTSNATRMTIASNGYVGIGTTSPVGALHVIASDGAAALYLENSSTNSPYLQFKSGGFIQDVGSGAVRVQGVGANSYLTFDTNSISRMTVDASGNVGIGTTTPTSRVSITDSINPTPTARAQTIEANTSVSPTANESFNPASRRLSTLAYIHVPATSTKSVSSLKGVIGAVENFGSANVGRIEGINGWAWHTPVQASNWITNSIIGVSGYAEVDIGKASTLKGMDAWSGCYSGAVVTSQYGIQAGVDSAAGTTVTYRYGLHLYTSGAGTVTNDYGIHQQGAPKNYFEGYTGFGTTTPQTNIHIHQPSAATSTELNFTNSLIGASAFGLELGLVTNSYDAYLWNAQNGNLRLATNSTARLTIAANGNINIVNNLNVQGSTVVGALTATSLSGAIVGTGNLKTAVGAVTGSNYQGTVIFNDYSFFPNFQATTGSSFESLGLSHSLDDATYVGKCAISTDDAFVIRWRYITATDTPTVWILIDPDSNEVLATWVSDDPIYRELDEFVEDSSGLLTLQKRKIASTESPIQSNTGIPQLVSIDTLSEITIPKNMKDSADRHIDKHGLKQENRLYRALQFHTKDLAPATWLHQNCGWDPVGKVIRELSSKEKKAKKAKLQIK